MQPLCGRDFVRGFGQASTNQQGGRGQARVFTLTQQDAQASNAIVAGTVSICFLDARVLLDLGATHSFVFRYLLRSQVGKLRGWKFLYLLPLL